MDYDTNQLTATGVCTEACIYGDDGTAWAYTPNCPELLADYTFDLPDMVGNTTPVQLNEIDIAVKAGQGERAPSAAGIRLANKKFMFINHIDSMKTTALSTIGGGAAIGKTATGFVLAYWSKTEKDSNGELQSNDRCITQVSAMAEYLTSIGL